LTPGHLNLLHKLEAKELVLLLDGDDAGRKAVERLAGIILSAGVSARVAALPDGEDPDTFARKMGDQAITQLVSKAPSLTEYLFKTILPKGTSSSFEEKMSAVDRLKPIASVIPMGLMRSAFFGSLAQHSGLPAAELESSMKAKNVSPVKPVPKPISGTDGPPPDVLEAMFAVFVLRDVKFLEKDSLRVVDELKHQEIKGLMSGIQSGQSPSDAQYEASETMKKGLQKAREQLPFDDGSMEHAFGVVCRRLKLRTIEEHLRRIARETGQVPGASELTDEARVLLEQRGQLLALKRELLAKNEN